MSKIEVNTVDVASGSTLTLGSSGKTIALASGTTNSINVKDLDWQSVQTSSFTAVAGRGYPVNTTGGAITLTLPASPSAGDTVAILDYAATFGTNNLTVARHSSNIQGAAANGVLNTNRQAISFVYIDSTKGWIPFNDNATGNYGAAYVAATGGTETTSGDYKIHTFNSSSNFVVSDGGNSAGSNSVDYVVVAGGGSGGQFYGGGGGAGGYRESHSTPVSGPYTASPLATPTAISVSAQTYPITVGGGGAGQPTGNTPGNDGSSSVFSTITSAGGGGGGGAPPSGSSNGRSGGSGGGGAYNGATGGSGNTPPVSPPQGNAGGTPNGNSSSGGGAGAAGSNNNNAAGGTGVGTAINPAVGTPGPDGGLKYFAGGGASAGGGGASVGGGGPRDATPSAGTANTGGGGAGNTGAAGGSGIVIIRYKYQ